VAFIVELSTRRAEIAGITSEPEVARMSQMSRNVPETNAHVQ
jgi:hypothetical protein